jgi:hypothetical protein
MNSMPQHEVANGNGHKEFDLAKPITLSNEVANNPGAEYPSGGATLLYVVINQIFQFLAKNVCKRHLIL